MAARKSSRVNPKYKTRYCVENWSAYERGLRARGDITIWFSDEAVAAWTPPPTGQRGGQRQYSNLAILTSLTLRLVFHLPLRQTEGFVGSLLHLMGLDLKAPDHSTLSRRGEDVEVPPLCRGHDGPIHLVVDSTGLKISGAGDWNSWKHRKGKGRRGWRKLHIGVDDEGFVVAAQLTKSRRDDASVVPDLLEQIDTKVNRFTGDGAYDRRLVYDKVVGTGTEDVVVVVPPRRSAVADKNASGAWSQRNSHLERLEEIGPAGLVEGVRISAAGSSGECVLPLEVHSRRPTTIKAFRGSETGGDNRMRGSQPDVRARQAEVAADRSMTGLGERGRGHPGARSMQQRLPNAFSG